MLLFFVFQMTVMNVLAEIMVHAEMVTTHLLVTVAQFIQDAIVKLETYCAALMIVVQDPDVLKMKLTIASYVYAMNIQN